jgi:hypothetical protein
LRYGRISDYDRTLDQQFVRRVSECESENEMTIDQGLVSIPVPQDLLGKFGAAIKSDVPQQNFPEANVIRDDNWNSYFDQMCSKSQGQPAPFNDHRTKPRVPHNAKGKVVSPPRRPQPFVAASAASQIKGMA